MFTAIMDYDAATGAIKKYQDGFETIEAARAHINGDALKADKAAIETQRAADAADFAAQIDAVQARIDELLEGEDAAPLEAERAAIEAKAARVDAAHAEQIAEAQKAVDQRLSYSSALAVEAPEFGVRRALVDASGPEPVLTQKPDRTPQEMAAGVVLKASQFWPSVSFSLGLTPADGDPKTYLAGLIQASARLSDAEKVLALAYTNSAQFARADSAKDILEKLAMDATLGNPPDDADEATRLAAARAALDQLYLVGATL